MPKNHLFLCYNDTNGAFNAVPDAETLKAAVPQGSVQLKANEGFNWR